jgi:hypothetical protein
MHSFASCKVSTKTNVLPFSLCIISKGAKRWKHVCIDYGLFKWNLPTLAKKTITHIEVVMFDQCFIYQVVILMCCNY